MRPYSQNSSQAAARIVALLLVCDGNVSRQELDAIHARDIERRLGLESGQFAQVLHQLCEDLLMGARDLHLLADSIGQNELNSILNEVTDEGLRQQVVYFADKAAMADQLVAVQEAWIMGSILRQWRVVALAD